MWMIVHMCMQTRACVYMYTCARARFRCRCMRPTMVLQRVHGSGLEFAVLFDDEPEWTVVMATLASTISFLERLRDAWADVFKVPLSVEWLG